MQTPDLSSPQYFSNRELSFLEFNERVLAQARDERWPLLERLRFLCISCNNLDEFFEIRVAGLRQRLDFGATQTGPERMAISLQLEAIHARAARLVEDQYACLNDLLLPAMQQENIRLLATTEWTTDETRWLEDYFAREV